MDEALSCGLSFDQSERILLAHGGGGRLMQQLIKDVFHEKLGNSYLSNEHDAAILPVPNESIAFTTDTYVVRPLFFSGGDIGKLAVFGTVNDLAMAGARPLFLSLGVILEEGFPLETLNKIIQSVKLAAEACQVQIVTGDTKVVERGKGDGIFINTSGVGLIQHRLKIEPTQIESEDVVIVSGDLGRHGIAILAAREGLEFETQLESDCAPLSHLVLDLLESGVEIHCMRDLTRGGLASSLNEIASTAKLSIWIEEGEIPVQDEVRGACELLGLDPLYVANEGRMVLFVPSSQTPLAMEVLRRHEVGKEARVIGRVQSKSRDGDPPRVYIKSQIGVSRVLDLLSGEQLPRIC